MNAKNEAGVILERGPQNWQIYQQNKRGTADIELGGRWIADPGIKQAQVLVRVMDEAQMRTIGRAFDWTPAKTNPDGTWSIVLKRVPAGGLYRIETVVQFDGCPVEWARRGDMRHHVGVGDVWVIAGQSNAAGYGKTPCPDAPELGIHQFHASGEWRLATHPLDDSTDTQYPANREGANASHSPFLAFARMVKRAVGYPIGLVPAALGGSAIASWAPGPGSLFDNMLAYVRDAGGGCRGVLWYQGESDTAADSHPLYAKRFAQFVKHCRRAFRRPDLPVITVQLNRHRGAAPGDPSHAGWEAIREIQRQAARMVKGVEVVSALDLGLSDGIHNHSSANVILGERMAAAALGAAYGRPVKYRCPDLERVTRVAPDAIELVFANVDVRLHYEGAIPAQFPFEVRDAAGVAPMKGWWVKGKDVLHIDLARPIRSAATVVGAPTACPPADVPFDIGGYLPMLAFTAAIPD